jgi:hypothetical protein
VFSIPLLLCVPPTHLSLLFRFTFICRGCDFGSFPKEFTQWIFCAMATG